MAIAIKETAILDDEFDTSNMEEQLSCLCHDCREDRRFDEDSVGASECRSMVFDGRFAENVQRRIDLMSLTLC